MSRGERLLARLNASVVNLACFTCNKASELTASDIAGALAGLPRGPYLLVRYLWCEDLSVAKELFTLLTREIQQVARHKNWVCKNDVSRLKAFINLAVLDMKNISLCKTCAGTGAKLNQICAHCHGSGKKKRTQAQAARLCGIKSSNWKRSWEEKYQEVFMCISGWNDLGLNHLLTRL